MSEIRASSHGPVGGRPGEDDTEDWAGVDETGGVVGAAEVAGDATGPGQSAVQTAAADEAWNPGPDPDEVAGASEVGGLGD